MRCVLFTVALAVNAGCASIGGPRADPSAQEAAELNLQLGVGYMQQGHFDVALEKLEKALAYNDQLPAAHNVIGVLYDETNQPTLAEYHFQQALKLDPNFTLAKLNYAQFLCTNDKPQAAESEYLAIAENPPQDATDLVYRAYTGAAICALKIPAHDRADRYLRQALTVKPNDKSTLYGLADLNYSIGNHRKARGFLQRYHAEAGYNPESLWLGISIEKALGDAAMRQRYTQLLLSRFADSDVARRLESQ